MRVAGPGRVKATLHQQVMATLHPQVMATLHPQVMATLHPQVMATLHPQVSAYYARRYGHKKITFTLRFTSITANSVWKKSKS